MVTNILLDNEHGTPKKQAKITQHDTGFFRCIPGLVPETFPLSELAVGIAWSKGPT